MSRNFDLLRRAEKDAELFQTPARFPDPPQEPTQRAQKDAELFQTPGILRASRNGNRTKPRGTASLQEEEIALVQRVFLARSENAPRVVVFCGAERGDASSEVCARAGEILAAQNVGTVCVVEANLNSPLLARHFRMEPSSGLVDAILQANSVRGLVQEVVPGSLWLLGHGSHASNGQAILTLDGLKRCVSELRSEFKYVLIDAPPANVYADAPLMGQCADGVILVLKSNSTRRGAALRAKESLAAANVNILGAVLTDRTFPIPERIYRRL